MNYRNFTFTDSKYLICMEKKTYRPIGRGWASVPFGVDRSVVNAEFYQNYIQAVPFFNSWGDGASCRARCSYESAGYLPTTVTTVAPFRTEKQVTRFRFFYLPLMEKAAGWRGKEILKNAVSWDEKVDGARWLLTLYTKDNGVTASGVYDLNADTWRG